MLKGSNYYNNWGEDISKQEFANIQKYFEFSLPLGNGYTQGLSKLSLK